MSSNISKLSRFKYDKNTGHIDNHPKGKFTSYKIAERIILDLEMKVTELYKEITYLQDNQCNCARIDEY